MNEKIDNSYVVCRRKLEKKERKLIDRSGVETPDTLRK